MYDVTVEDGKYRFIYFDDGRLPQAFRNGRRWPAMERDMVGNKAMFALVARIAELEAKATYPSP